jgi:transcriptional regulator with XRE-family HTH domain
VLTSADKSGRTRRDCRCLRARHRHGTRAAYNRDGCRCRSCIAANTATARRRRRELAAAHWNGAAPIWVNPVGTHRRLRALTAAGWSTTQLADELGVTRSAIAHLRNLRQERILAATAANVVTLYERLWWRTPPSRSTTRSERYAERRGWAPPWRWDGLNLDDPSTEPLPDKATVDAVAVAEAAAGRHVRLTRAERHAAELELEHRGLAAGAIAAALGTSTRTVQRHRSRQRTAA